MGRIKLRLCRANAWFLVLRVAFTECPCATARGSASGGRERPGGAGEHAFTMTTVRGRNVTEDEKIATSLRLPQKAPPSASAGSRTWTLDGGARYDPGDAPGGTRFRARRTDLLKKSFSWGLV